MNEIALLSASDSKFNWYGFLIATGIVLCVVGAYFTAKHRGIEGDIVIDVIIIGLPLAIIFARIYYVIFDLIAGGHWTFLRFIGADDNGLRGLAIYGALIGAVIGAFLLSLWKNRKKVPEDKRISFFQILDLVFTFVMLGQAIGRWGNFANEEAHGYAITDPSKKWFPMGVEVNGTWYYATFFYEFVWNTVGFALMFFLYAGKHKSFDGFNFACYCLFYGAGRVWIEGMRSDSLWLVPPTDPATGAGGVRVSQLVSILIMVMGAALIVIHCIRAKRAGKKIFIFVRRDKLNDDYFGYEKTKLAHPMPDIKFRKDRNSKPEEDDIIIDNNGVAIRVDRDKEQAKDDGAAEKTEQTSEKSAEQKKPQAQETEEVYEDRWDD